MKEKLPTLEESDEGLAEKDMNKLTKIHKNDMALTKEEEDWMLNQEIRLETKYA